MAAERYDFAWRVRVVRRNFEGMKCLLDMSGLGPAGGGLGAAIDRCGGRGLAISFRLDIRSSYIRPVALSAYQGAGVFWRCGP